MKKKLIALNLALIAALCAIGWQLRSQWDSSRERETRVIDAVLKPAHIPPPLPVPVAKPLAPASYAQVAQKMLFAADRNPNIILDPVAPPKPKPVPPFPAAHGVMIWGDVPPTIILSEKGSQDQKSYRVGEKIGDFTIAKITNDEVTFAWDGKQFEKKLDDLIDNTPPPAQAAPQRQVAQNANAQSTSLSPQDKQGPGITIGTDMKGCQPGDSSASGTVMDGMKKIVTATPFGSSCRWEKVQ